MSAFLSPVFGAAQRALSNAAMVLAGGLLSTYQAGSTTPMATWTDSTQAVPNANPIVFDAYGLLSQEIWLQAGQAYKFVLTDANGVNIGTWDNISGINDTASSTSEWVASGLTPTYVSASSFTVPGNHTTLFTTNRRIQAKVSAGTVYGTISSSSFSSSTTVNVTMDAGQSLDAGLSVVNVSLLDPTNPSVQATGVAFNSSDSNKATNLQDAVTNVSASPRNLVINGAMEIDQRNSGGATTPTAAAFVIDRWLANLSVASKLTFQQVADAPPGFINSLKATVASQYAPGTSEAFFLTHAVEGLNCTPLNLGLASALTVTVSFWAKASVPGTYSMFLRNSAANRYYCFTQALTASWVRYTKTLQLDATGTWLTTNGIGLQLGFDLGSGTASQGAAGAWGASTVIEATGALQFVNQVGTSTLNLTGVQIEPGSAAKAFERLSYPLELLRCLRYFTQVTGLSAATNFGTGQVFTTTAANMNLPGNMRATPTVTVSGLQIFDGSTTLSISAVNGVVQGANQITVPVTVTGGTLAVGRAGVFKASGTSDYIRLDADI